MRAFYFKKLSAAEVFAVVISILYLKLLLFDLIWAFDTTFSGFQFPIGWLTKLALATLLSLPLLICHHKWYMYTVSVIVDIWLIANLMYFRTYYTVIPFHSYGLAGNLADFQASVWESLRWVDLVFPLTTAAMATLMWDTDLRMALRRTPRRLRLWLTAFIVIPVLTVTVHTLIKGSYKEAYEDLMYDYSSCGAAVYTIPGTWAYEFVSGATELSDKQRADIKAWLDARPGRPRLPYTIGRRDNCIIILCESLESWVLEKKVDGTEITPNLNRFLSEADVLYAPKVLSQVKGARSIDGQLLLHTGMLPVAYGAYSSRFPHHTYCSLDKAFKEHWGSKSQSMSFTVDKKTVWNAGIVAQDFGYDRLLDKPYWTLDVKTGPRGRLGDHSFMRQAAERLESEEFFPTDGHTIVQCVTYSGHTPFVIPDSLKAVSFDDRYPERMRNYMTVANYTDRAIGEFVDRLRANPKFRTTMIVITGDHEGIGVDRARFVKDPKVATIMSDQQFVPLIVLNSPVEMRYDGVMGQVDMYPTLLDLLGLGGYEWRGLGQSILDPAKPPIAVSAQNEIIGDASAASAAEIEHARMAYSISDLMISSDWFRVEKNR